MASWNASKTRKITMVGMLSAVAAVLMYLNLSVALMPSFIKLDVSELPALLAAYALGPMSGAAVCLIKNLVNLMNTNTGGVGELSNFLLGLCFVLPAGLLYQHKKNRKMAFIGALIGAVAMACMSVVTNYFVVYPIYYQLFMTEEEVLMTYQAINPRMDSILECLICFNLPFTFVKGMCSVAIVFPIYKKLAPFLKGKKA